MKIKQTVKLHFDDYFDFEYNLPNYFNNETLYYNDEFLKTVKTKTFKIRLLSNCVISNCNYYYARAYASIDLIFRRKDSSDCRSYFVFNDFVYRKSKQDYESSPFIYHFPIVVLE